MVTGFLLTANCWLFMTMNIGKFSPHKGKGARQLKINVNDFYKRVVKEGAGGGFLIPFPRKLFFGSPSSNPTIPACVAQIEIPLPFFYCFFFHESQSQCTKSHFPASKKGKSQLPFYLFTTLVQRYHLEGVELEIKADNQSISLQHL